VEVWRPREAGLPEGAPRAAIGGSTKQQRQHHRPEAEGKARRRRAHCQGRDDSVRRLGWSCTGRWPAQGTALGGELKPSPGGRRPLCSSVPERSRAEAVGARRPQAGGISTRLMRERCAARMLAEGALNHLDRCGVRRWWSRTRSGAHSGCFVLFQTSRLDSATALWAGNGTSSGTRPPLAEGAHHEDRLLYMCRPLGSRAQSQTTRVSGGTSTRQAHRVRPRASAVARARVKLDSSSSRHQEQHCSVYLSTPTLI
jgi:hypothetical protein